MTNSNEGRTYAGVSAEQRQVQRRAALVSAGLELFGTQGYVNVSVKSICSEAGLTQRYFYESFPDRAALLSAVYSDCVEAARAETLTAAAAVFDEAGLAGGTIDPRFVPRLADTALGAFISHLANDPRRARVIMIEVVGVCPEIEKLRLDAIHGWADLILGFVAGTEGPTAHQRLTAIGVVGAITQLLVDWQTAVANTDVHPEVGTELFQIEAIHAVITDLFIATYDRVFSVDAG